MQARARLKVLEKPTPREGLRPAIEDFLRRAEAKGLSPRTLDFYRFRLKAFTDWLEAQGFQGGPEDLTPPLLRDFLSHERERTSPANARHGWSALSALCAFLLADGAIAENPMEKVERPRVPQKLVKPLTEEEVERLLAQGNPRTFAGARLRALVMVLVDCDLRASELCGLNHDEVDWVQGTLKVMGKGGKERIVPFGEATRRALLTYVARRGEVRERALFVTVYGERLTRYELHHILSDAGEKAGVAGVYAHRLRHTCAVSYLRNGGDALSLQRLLGHSSLDMVRRYVNLADGDLVVKHRQASPGDRFAEWVKPTNGRRRLR
jgi:site-specific recombinase XerD